MKTFIDRFIDSVEQLEILMLLFHSDRPWTSAEVVSRIQSSLQSVERRLIQLSASGLPIRHENGKYQYNRDDAEFRLLIAEVDKAYNEKRVRVIESIYTRKRGAIETFADAFRIRRDK